jgi:hypothetical protein
VNRRKEKWKKEKKSECVIGQDIKKANVLNGQDKEQVSVFKRRKEK